MIENIINGFVGAVLAVSSFLGLYQAPAPIVETPIENLGAVVNPVAGATYTLSGGGVSSSATSIVLTSLTLPQNGYPIQDADLSATFYITLEPGNRSRQEVVSCTTVVQNAAGTATLSGCTRGLSPITPYTASSSLQFAHGGGSQVVFSDPPQLFNQYPAKANDETITGQWTFDTFPITPSNSPASETVSGISELSTGAEAAASTLSGSLGRLVLPARIATSTYNSATAGNVVPVTDSIGHLDPGFVSSSTLFSVTGFTDLQATSSVYIGDFVAWEIGKQEFISTTTGTSTWSVPSGISKVWVYVAGPGGDGGGCNAAGDDCAGSGGGAGGYTWKVVDLTGTSTIQYHIGASSPTAWTTFGTNGYYIYATAGGDGAANNGPGGAGGCGFKGIMNICGSTGGYAIADGTAGPLAAGIGGSNPLGFGGGQSGSSYDTSGIGGSGCGGGGGGGSQGGNSGGGAGGAGSDGCLIIRW